MAVLLMPSMLFKSALKPMAVLAMPVVLSMSASSPRTVLLFVKQPSWQVARACGESAKQVSANGMRRSARKGERFIEFPDGKDVVFIRRRVLKKIGQPGKTKNHTEAASARTLVT